MAEFCKLVLIIKTAWTQSEAFHEYLTIWILPISWCFETYLLFWRLAVHPGSSGNIAASATINGNERPALQCAKSCLNSIFMCLGCKEVIGCWVGPFFVHKCSENGMIHEGWQEFLTYKYRSSQWIRSDAYILSSSFILSIYIYLYLIYLLHLLTWIILNPPLSQCKWCCGQSTQMDCNFFHHFPCILQLVRTPFIHRLSGKSPWKLERTTVRQNWNSDSVTVMTYCCWYPHRSQTSPTTSSN